MADDIFSRAYQPEGETPPANPENHSEAQAFLDRYVGDGKKYKTVEDLAKAYYHADTHISEISRDSKSLRAELEELKEFTLAQIASQKANSTNPTEPPAVPGDKEDKQPEPAPLAPSKGGDGEDDLETRINKILEERDTTKRAEQNAALTEEVMVNHFGDKAEAAKAVREKAAELEVDPSWLASTAFSSPRAFFNIMGISPEEKPRSANTPGPRSDVDPTRFANTNSAAPKEGTYRWYEHIRKTDPSRYWSSNIQQSLMADAQRLGDDFFKR